MIAWAKPWNIAHCLCLLGALCSQVVLAFAEEASDTFEYEVPSWCIMGDGTYSLLVGRQVTLQSELPGPLYSFEIEPELPGGLELDSITGTVHGTPSGVADLRSYTVVASLGDTKLRAALSFQVVESLPGSSLRTLAGSRESGLTATGGGHGMSLQMESPTSLHVHGETLFIAARATILQLDLTTSQLTVFIGKPGEEGFVGDGLPREQALLGRPWGMLVLEDELFFVDSSNHVIRKAGLRPGSLVERVAGTGKEGFSGDGVPALEADLSHPIQLVEYDERLFFSDSFNHCVRAIQRSTGIIRTITGNCGTRGFGYDKEPSAQAQFSYPHDITISRDVLYIADWGNRRIRMMNMTSDAPVVRTIAGAKSPEAPAVDYSWIGPVCVAVSEDGKSLYTSATREHLVLEINLQDWIAKPKALGKARVIAGTGKPDEGEPEKEVTKGGLSPLNTPRGILVRGKELYVTEYHRVRAVDLAARAKPPPKPKGKARSPAKSPSSKQHSEL